MKQPFMKRFPVFEHDYLEKNVTVDIYSCFEKTPRDDYDDEDADLDEDEAQEDEVGLSRYTKDSYEKNKISKIPLSKLTLQSLLDNLPEGVTPSDVKIGLSIDCSDMAVEGANLSFYYEKQLPARPELYKQDKEAYDKERAEYEEKNAAYNKWKKKEDIKELEIRLAKVKADKY